MANASLSQKLSAVQNIDLLMRQWVRSKERKRCHSGTNTLSQKVCTKRSPPPLLSQDIPKSASFSVLLYAVNFSSTLPSDNPWHNGRDVE
jgi:hypothetical protein